MTGGGGRGITWTSFNQAASIAKGASTSTFSFGAGHERVKQVSHLETTIYVGGLFEKVTPVGAGAVTEYKHYIVAPTGRVAVYTDRSSLVRDARFFHTDGLGSITAVSDEKGAIVKRFAFDAWGKRIDPASGAAITGTTAASFRRGYTDHEQLDDLGLVHMNGRVYLPRVLDCEVVAVSSSGTAVLSDIPRLRPDVVLLDLGLPDLPPKQLVEAVLAVADNAKVIAFTALLNPVTLHLVEENKLHGYLDKLGGHKAGLKEAISTVLAGRVYRPAWFREKLSEARAMRQSFVNVLTEREEEVLALIGEACSDQEIAGRQGWSVAAAHAHRVHIMEKLDLHSTPELMRYAIDQGFTVADSASLRRPA